ncbi:MAG: hypothetical protein U9N59_09960 [Campylobacterota bacterium]|nr:hypothetical protein [Campylobacterota bacterium]
MNAKYNDFVNTLLTENSITCTETALDLLLNINIEVIKKKDYEIVENYLSTILVYNRAIKESDRGKLTLLLEDLRIKLMSDS